MAETRSRSIRIADDVWEAIQALPGKTDDALRSILVTRKPVVDTHAEVNRWFRETWERLDEIYALAMNGVGVDTEIAKTFARVVAPASIPGVSVGLKAAQGFDCRCIHSGCSGAKFTGAYRGSNLCPACLELGHKGEPRNCPECNAGLAA